MKNFYSNLKLYLRWTIYIVTKFYYLAIPIIALINYYYFTCDILLCDNPDEALSWETYNRSYEYQYRSAEYQPYRPGLQETSEGYRFELPADNSTSPPVLRVNINGKVVFAEYSGQDIQGNPMYTYKNHNFSVDSTQLGLIEPTRSEVLGKGYYQGSGWGHKVTTNKYDTNRRSIWNKIKSDFKSARQSASKDRTISLQENNKLMSNIRSSRANNHMRHQEGRNNLSTNYNYNRRIRRFD